MIDTALILPSRGLIHSQTVEAIWPSEYGYNYTRPYFAHSLPLPECFNEPIGRALADSVVEYICIIEEDIVPPFDWYWTLIGPLARREADITFMDYNFNNGPVTHHAGGVLITGTGCIMFTRAVAEALTPFSSNHRYMESLGRLIPMPTLSDEDALKVYGMHDVQFCVGARKAGFRFQCVGKADHLKVSEYGQSGTNNGAHKIERLTFDD